MRRFTTLLFAIALLATPHADADIKITKHNLSTGGAGPIKAETEGGLCIFCHSTHRSKTTVGVLWNHEDSLETYIPYDSPTLMSTPDQPTGASKLCLSCHDGTIALGALFSEQAEIGMVGGVRFMPVGPTLIGSDLSDDHPISFDYDSALAAVNPDLVDPAMLTGAVQLDQFGQLQCTACHDPHDDSFGKFLVASTRNSELCLECHDPLMWGPSSHATSPAIWDGNPPDPWPHTDHTTVGENACENCHRPHGAGSTTWILNYVAEEDNCLACHNGQVAATDIEADLAAPFIHPVQLTLDLHSPTEDPTLPMTEHVECTDCHDPHAVTDTAGFAPAASGALLGISGVDNTGGFVEPVTNQYEVCFKCHATFPMSDPPISRQILENDKLLQFDLTNPSYHPVEGPGKNPDVPSLIAPLTETSVIYCTDCHASDLGPGAGGSGAAGPHGSMYEFILERQYNILDNIKFDPMLYDLCFKCHSEQSLRNGDSFKHHKKHFEGAKAACGVCHDPHGISSLQGNAINNSHLINFDTTVVSPDRDSGRLEFVDLGNKTGECYLECHNKKHNPKKY